VATHASHLATSSVRVEGELEVSKLSDTTCTSTAARGKTHLRNAISFRKRLGTGSAGKRDVEVDVDVVDIYTIGDCLAASVAPLEISASRVDWNSGITRGDCLATRKAADCCDWVGEEEERGEFEETGDADGEHD